MNLFKGHIKIIVLHFAYSSSQSLLNAQRKKIEKEQTHYQTAYEKLLKQLEENPDNADLLTKKSELENQLNDIDKAIKDIDYREANQRAGYVYIISFWSRAASRISALAAF